VENVELSLSTFNGCRYCPDRKHLFSSDNEEIKIRNRSLDVFLYLAQNSPSLVSHDSIYKAVWKNTVVTRDSLHQCVKDIRRALKDEDKRVLQTVPRRGFRLVPDVTHDLADVPRTISFPNEELDYAISSDNTKLAWRQIGEGIPLLKASNWIADVDMVAGKLLYSHFYSWLASRSTFIRFDQRGTGLSDRHAEDLSIDLMVDDMDAVAQAAGANKFFLFGASQGAAYCLAYAHRFPEKVLGLIFRGAMIVGPGASGDPQRSKWFDTARTVVQNGWDSGDHGYRRYFSSRIAAEASPDVLQDLDEIQRLSISADMIIKNFEFLDQLDLQPIAAQTKHPTLIMHSKGDVMVPFSEGRRVHRLMPHAEFVTLDGSNHAVLPNTSAFTQVCDSMDAFMQNIISEHKP